MLGVLANVDADLTAAVAEGLGLPAPKATVDVADVDPSPALSQVGRPWPTSGRIIGIIADESSNLAEVTDLQNSIVAAGMQALVIAPHGGTLTAGAGDPVIVQRTLLTTRSTEFDAVVVAGSPAPAPKMYRLLEEAFRHVKVIGGWGGAEEALAAVGFPTDAPGVVIKQDAAQMLEQVVELLAEHRVWHRFPVQAS